MTIARVLLLISMLLMLPAPAFSKIIYVATTGNDANSGLVVGSPVRSCEVGISKAVAGDTVTLADGTYQDNDGTSSLNGIVCYVASSYNAGVAGNPIRLTSTNQGGAIIQLPDVYTGGGGNHCVFVNKQYWIIDGLTCTGSGIAAAQGHAGITFYTGSSNSQAINNILHDITRTLCSSSAFGNAAILVTNNPASLLIERNRIYHHGRLRNGESGCVTSIYQHDHGMYVQSSTNIIIRENETYDTNRGFPLHFSGGTNIGASVYNNTIAGQATQNTGASFCGASSAGHPCPRGQIKIATTFTNGTFKNNLHTDSGDGVFSFTNGAVVSGMNYDYNLSDDPTANMWSAQDGGKPAGATDGGHNKTNQSPGIVSLGSNNYRLAAGSAAIAAGVNVGYPLNGAAPSIGAYDPPVFSSCVVENATPSKLSITMSNSLFPPLLPSSGITGFTSRKAGSNNVITAAVRTGTNQIDLTLTNAIVGGNAVDISTSGAGNVTDSALIGGTLSQPYNTVLTNQACTNNVGAGASYVLTQTDFRWNGLRGTEAAPVSTPYAAAPQNTNIYAVPGAKARLRASIVDSVANAPAIGFIPWFSRNGGAYAILGDTFGADNVAFCGTSPDPDIPITGTPTTNQLTTPGAFVAGALLRTSNAIPPITLLTGNKTEMEVCIAWGASVAPNDTFDFRFRRDDTTVLLYTTTPRVTIIGSQGGSGF